MTNRFEHRVGQDKQSLVMTADQLEFERRKRLFYNKRHPTAEGRAVMMLCSFGNINLPAWLDEELRTPIPADAPKAEQDKAEARAMKSIGRDLNMYNMSEVAHEETAAINDFFELISIFAGRPVESFRDFREWLRLRGDRPGQQSCPVTD